MSAGATWAAAVSKADGNDAVQHFWQSWKAALVQQGTASSPARYRAHGSQPPTAELYPHSERKALQEVWEELGCPEEREFRVSIAIKAVLAVARAIDPEIEDLIPVILSMENPEIAFPILGAQRSIDTSGHHFKILYQHHSIKRLIDIIAISGMQPIEYLTRGLAGPLLPRTGFPVQFSATSGPFINRPTEDVTPEISNILCHVAQGLTCGWQRPENPTLCAFWRLYEDFFPGACLVPICSIE